MKLRVKATGAKLSSMILILTSTKRIDCLSKNKDDFFSVE